jgi:ABC-type uncharacterized transport system substrate-binding protein
MKNVWFLKLVTCACFVLSLAGVVHAKKVMILHSYHEGYSWTDDIDKGARKTLEGSGAEIKTHYMDCKRKPTDEDLANAVTAAKADIDAWKPDIVITSDDSAQKVTMEYANKDGAPQFVFCGVNAELSKYNFPAKNVTGILERALYNSSLNMMKKINPEAKTIAILGDSTNTDKLVIGQIKNDKTDTDITIVGTINVVTFDEFKKAFEEFQGKADIIGFVTCRSIKDKVEDPKARDPKETFAWVAANMKKPTIGFWNYLVKEGVLCGITPSGNEHGSIAAKIAVEMLGGKTAADIPVITAQNGTVCLNMKTAKAMGAKVPYELVKSAQEVVKE